MGLYDLMKYNDNNIHTYMLILDLTKTVDTVPYDRLQYNLRHYGIPGDILNWIYVFLKQREWGMVVDGKRSCWVHVDLGVPIRNCFMIINIPAVY